MTQDDARLAPLKRAAKTLHRAHASGDRQAQLHMRQWVGEKTDLKHADFLHAVARERGFESWPKLKLAVEAEGLSRAQAQQRLRQALVFGQKAWVDRLLADWPDLAERQFELLIALHDLDGVHAILGSDPAAATRAIGPRRPLLHLCFSRYGQMQPDQAHKAVDIAKLLVAHGADVNDGFPAEPGTEHLLSALYGAIDYARNLDLARWLLEQGATPNDNECLYHATEQRDLRALELLLAFDADPAGTNALFRAMDFDDLRAVEMLLDAGADPNEGLTDHPTGPVPKGLSAFHHAAQRMCGAGMITLLAARGARLDVRREGLTAYATARLYGNDAAAEALASLGAPQDMPEALSVMLEGHAPLDPAKLPESARALASELAGVPGTLPRLKQMIATGLEWDRPDHQGLTPVQAAGWAGLPEAVAYFLSLKPDLSHINGYGGTLLSTIIHGSENAPEMDGQEHIACLQLALHEGVALPEPAIRHAGREDVAAFLEDWAERHPGQVVAHGIA